MSRKTRFTEPKFDNRERFDTQRLRYGIMRGELTIPLSRQVSTMKESFPGFNHQWTGNTVIWEGFIKPAPLSQNYKVQVTYCLERPPRVLVLEPKLLRRPDGKRIPHTYHSGYLCLYYPKWREFTRNNLICDTIIPWTSLWLFCYEGWLATGEWLGGGIHREPDEEP